MARSASHGFTAGTGLIMGSVLMDAAYLYEYGSYLDGVDHKITQRTHRFLASVIYLPLLTSLLMLDRR